MELPVLETGSSSQAPEGSQQEGSVWQPVALESQPQPPASQSKRGPAVRGLP